MKLNCKLVYEDCPYRSGLATIVDLAEGTRMMQLESALERRLTKEHLSLYNVDGSMCKTVKRKLLGLFKQDLVTTLTMWIWG